VFEKLRRYLPHTHLCGKPYSKAKFVKLLQWFYAGGVRVSLRLSTSLMMAIK
jgi:hypothetical protein